MDRAPTQALPFQEKLVRPTGIWEASTHQVARESEAAKAESRSRSISQFAPHLIFDLDETILHSIALDDPEEVGLRPVWAAPLPGEGGINRRSRTTSRSERIAEARCRRNCATLADAQIDGAIYGGFFVSFLRPGIMEALRLLSERFVLCLCTFGCHRYVAEVLSALDPNKQLFGDRVMDRQCFPGGKKLIPTEWGSFDDVVVVDDQPGVWESRTIVLPVLPFFGEAPDPGSAESEWQLRDLAGQLLAALESYDHPARPRGFAKYLAAQLVRLAEETPKIREVDESGWESDSDDADDAGAKIQETDECESGCDDPEMEQVCDDQPILFWGGAIGCASPPLAEKEMSSSTEV